MTAAEVLPRSGWAYTRISLDESGDELGVERQRQAIMARADEMGVSIEGEFSDNSMSAFRGKNRPGYLALMDAVRPGDVIFCTELSRLTRHPRELEDLVDLVERNSVAIVALRAGEMDLTTSGGRAVARLLGTISRMESEQLGERVSASQRQNADKGRAHGGNRPYGYERVAPGELVIVPHEAEMIREAIDRLFGGDSMNAIVVDWNERGVPTSLGKLWRPATLAKVLRSGRIAGLREWQGEVIGDATWPAIVDRPTWERVRNKINHTPAGRRPRVNLLAGMITCGECGAQMYARTGTKKGTNERVRNYACDKTKGRNHEGGASCGSCAIKAEHVEGVVVDHVLGALERVNLNAARARHTVDESSRLIADIAADEQLMSDLAGDMGARRMTRGEWLAAREPIEARLAANRRQLDQVSDLADMSDDAFVGVTEERWHDELTLDQRRAVIRLLLASIVVSKGKPGRRVDLGRITLTPA